MRSTRTMAEFEAAGLLLGWEYDAQDHTYMRPGEPMMQVYVCADTLERCYFGTGQEFVAEWDTRKDRVKVGELGASDYVSKQSKYK